jgi:general secretion pathway protein I
MKSQRGFTLLEMIVASTIMAIAIVGLLNGISGATRNASRLRDYDRVLQLARMQMDELLVDPDLAGRAGAFDPRLTGGIQAGWQAQVNITEAPPNPGPGQPSLERIELQIWWMSGQERRTFTLDAFRTRYAKTDSMEGVR